MHSAAFHLVHVQSLTPKDSWNQLVLPIPSVTQHGYGDGTPGGRSRAGVFGMAAGVLARSRPDETRSRKVRDDVHVAQLRASGRSRRRRTLRALSIRGKSTPLRVQDANGSTRSAGIEGRMAGPVPAGKRWSFETGPLLGFRMCKEGITNRQEDVRLVCTPF